LTRSRHRRKSTRRPQRRWQRSSVIRNPSKRSFRVGRQKLRSEVVLVAIGRGDDAARASGCSAARLASTCRPQCTGRRIAEPCAPRASRVWAALLATRAPLGQADWLAAAFEFEFTTRTRSGLQGVNFYTFTLSRLIFSGRCPVRRNKFVPQCDAMGLGCVKTVFLRVRVIVTCCPDSGNALQRALPRSISPGIKIHYPR
jgi:hypothetical protein